jgi:SAM-dependent methyltransferase
MLEVIGRKGGRCKACFSICSLELPSDEDLDAFYQHFNENYTGGGRRSGSMRRQLKYAKKYLMLIKSLPAIGNSLLDVGSSTNPLPNLALASGFRVTVLDFIRPHMLENNITFISGSIDKKRIKDLNDCFDVVTAFAVIEHCKYPFIAAKNLVSLCKPGGFIILTTPAIGGFGDKWAVGYSPWYNPPEHLHLMSSKGIQMIFEPTGAEVIKFGAFEITSIRKAIRWTIGISEGIIGLLVKSIVPSIWRRFLGTRVNKVQEIYYFIIRKKNANDNSSCA